MLVAARAVPDIPNWLTDVISCHSPHAIRFLHRRNRLHCGFLLFKTGVILNDHVLAIRSTRQCGGMVRGLQLSFDELTERSPGGSYLSHPLGFLDGTLEIPSCLLPTIA